jgi:hypothetical protein
VWGDFRPLQADGWNPISNAVRTFLHQKNGNAEQILQHEGREINLKKEFYKM